MTMRQQWFLITATKWVLALAILIGGGLFLESTSWSRWIKIIGDIVLLAVAASIVGGLHTLNEYRTFQSDLQRARDEISEE